MIEISKKILKQVGKTNGAHRLIKKRNKILLGLSGGKDSLTLAHTFKRIQAKAPLNFEFKTVIISYL